MPTPSQLNNGVVIFWNIPEEIKNNSNIDTVKVYRSEIENSDYKLIDTLTFQPGNIPNTYNDVNGTRKHFYLVTFGISSTGYESSYNIAYFAPLPKELRLIELVKRSFPDLLHKTEFFNKLTDYDYLAGLNLAVQMFNVYPPQTNYNLLNFPKSHEFFIVGFSQLLILASRFFPISIKDWDYSEPGGVTMRMNRGEKVNQAISIIKDIYVQWLPLVKLDFSSELPVGFGTVPLPLSMGGAISRGALNILNIFNMGG